MMIQTIQNILKSYIKDKLLLAIWLTYPILLGMIVIADDNHLPFLHIFQQLPAQLTLRILLVLLLTTICILLSVITLKNKFKNYTFNAIDGIWKHKKNDKWICASCKTENVLSELYFAAKYKMKCPRCGKDFDNFVKEFFENITRKTPNSIDLRDLKFKH